MRSLPTTVSPAASKSSTLAMESDFHRSCDSARSNATWEASNLPAARSAMAECSELRSCPSG